MKRNKTLSIVAFSVMMATLLIAILSDFLIFSETILTFIGAVFISAIAFVFFIILMVVSVMLVFGIILLEDYGFWPLDLSIQAFKEILADIQITADQIAVFRGLRIGILIICLITFVLARIALHKDEDYQEKVPFKGMSIVTMIFSILGILVAIGMLVISSNF